ncbi:hypothetical protein [Chroococcus sp. FPU101]|nr:hypothetical protein [Chroococcus sp. FPU101]
MSNNYPTTFNWVIVADRFINRDSCRRQLPSLPPRYSPPWGAAPIDS